MPARGDWGATKAGAFTASDTVADPLGCSRGVYCSGSGNATFLFEDDTVAVAINGMIAGVVYPFRVQRLNATPAATATLTWLG